MRMGHGSALLGFLGALTLLTSCVDEPDYLGRACSDLEPCPGALNCCEGVCTDVACVEPPPMCQPTNERCDDGIDNDCDGDVDCDDDNCNSAFVCCVASGPEICDDQIDNDCSGQTDCDDSACADELVCCIATGPEVCDDQVDNDCSGQTDCDDPACGDSLACCMATGPEVCDDQIDNDCSGQTDCDDSACASDPVCCVATGAEICDDQIDNDCSGQTDCDDPACAGDIVCCVADGPEMCDGRDNDCNGLIDDGLVPPLADLQAGVCAGAVKVCAAEMGWVEPDYTQHAATYAPSPEQLCDQLDNDCDGTADNNLQLPVGQCCGREVDDARCGAGAICEGTTCRTGAAGDLVLDRGSCTLAGVACPSTALIQDGSNPDLWILRDPALEFRNVTVRSLTFLSAPAYAANQLGGTFALNATGTVRVESQGAITMSGRGYGGGGGGGGDVYCDVNLNSPCDFGAAGGVGAAPDGELGGINANGNCGSYSGATAGAGDGGRGGGFGGLPGQPGGGCPASYCAGQGTGAGGDGAGPFGGTGADGTDRGYGNSCQMTDPQWTFCDPIAGNVNGNDPARDPPRAAGAGTRGGYAAPGINGDTSTDLSVRMGSGGGGGAGGADSSGWCCGGAYGGHGGQAGGAANSGCSGGGGGGGGGAGGGSVSVTARDIVIQGAVVAHGQGQASLNAGFGAGGGIMLYARDQIDLTGGRVTTLGGRSGGPGSTTNGGTVKVFYRRRTGPAPTASDAGRVLDVDRDG